FQISSHSRRFGHGFFHGHFHISLVCGLVIFAYRHFQRAWVRHGNYLHWDFQLGFAVLLFCLDILPNLVGCSLVGGRLIAAREDHLPIAKRKGICAVLLDSLGSKVARRWSQRNTGNKVGRRSSLGCSRSHALVPVIGIAVVFLVTRKEIRRPCLEGLRIRLLRQAECLCAVPEAQRV